MRPSVKNKRAIKSYMKDGFKESNASANEYLLEEYVSFYGDGDYRTEGEILLVRRFENDI